MSCSPVSGGWSCQVAVGEGPRATHHVVGVTQVDLRRLDPEAVDPTRLLERTFDFLLEREPATSILRAFDLPVVSRYFPEFESEIRRRLRA